jgi:hypothetical protein
MIPLPGVRRDRPFTGPVGPHHVSPLGTGIDPPLAGSGTSCEPIATRPNGTGPVNRSERDPAVDSKARTRPFGPFIVA